MSKKTTKAVLKEVQDFRDCVKRVVAMLSGKQIPVAERGNEAYVRYNRRGEPVLVNIPSIPDDASPTLMNAVRGFLDHEVAHILFTEPKVAMQMRERGKAPSTGLWNALEDVFIERRMGQVFNGTRRNLLATQSLVIDKYFRNKVPEAVLACHGDQRELFLKFFLCPVVRAWDGQSPFIDFMEEHWRLIERPVASAYTIADALDRINVPNIITGFTTFGSPDYETRSKRGFTRFEALMLPIIKNWNEKANSPEIRARMGCVCETFPLLNNVDGESVAQLATLFAGRMEDKKIMLVMSDGEPCATGSGFHQHLRTVTKEIETLSDIELMAIGILTDEPRRYYKNYALVNSVEELGPSVVTELSRIILG